MRHIVSTGVLAFGLMATTFAQAPAGGQRPAAKPDSAKAIVVTGCIGGGPAAFTLTNAMAATSTAKPGENPVGTAGISSSYDLTPQAGVELKAHVGHKVELTGTPVMAAAGEKPAPAAGAKPATPKLNVTALKMVSASCP